MLKCRWKDSLQHAMWLTRRRGCVCVWDREKGGGGGGAGGVRRGRNQGTLPFYSEKTTYKEYIYTVSNDCKFTYVIIFKNGSRICRKCCSGQFSKNLTSFCTASFLSKACSTFLLSLSCAKQTAMESNAVTDQSSSSSRLKYTSKPPWARNCSRELREAWAMSQSKGKAKCFNGESDMINCIKCGMIPFSAACSCLLLLILQRLKSALRTYRKESLGSFWRNGQSTCKKMLVRNRIRYIWKYLRT